MTLDLTPTNLAIYIGLATLAFGGWNAVLHMKSAAVKDIVKWRDEFVKDYQDHRLEMIEKFATKKELKESFDRLDLHLGQVRKEIIALRNTIENNG